MEEAEVTKEDVNEIVPKVIDFVNKNKRALAWQYAMKVANQ